MNKFINELTHIGDMLATPFFLLLTIYFYNIENRTLLQDILFLFSFACLIIYVTFSYFYLVGLRRKK